jgi:4-amino-4-deoxy-L-arabinose transferase-like glycosyltransferase
MLLCTVLYPANYGYDEPQHVDMAYAYAKGHGPYGPGERRPAIGVKATERGPGYPPARSFSDVPVAPRGARGSFEALGGDAPYPLGYPNQLVEHPPLAYLLDAAVLRVPGVSGLAYDKQYALLRFLGIALLAPLPLIAFQTATVLGLGRAVGLAAAVLPMAVPGLSRVGATVNNDTLLIALAALLTWMLARVVAGDLRSRTAVVVGLLTLLALLTKGFALLLPPVVLAAYLLAWRRHGVLPLRPAALALGISCLPGSLWYLHNLIAYGAVQPSGYGAAATQQILGPVRPGGTTVHFVTGFTKRMALRFVGGIGLPEGPAFDARVCWAWAIVFVAMVGFALAIGVRRDRLVMLLLIAPAIGVTAIVGLQARAAYAHHGGVFAGVQGRYLYLAIVGLAVAVAAGLVQLAGPRLSRWLPLALVLAVIATQALAWRTLLRAWWIPAAARGDRLAAIGGAWHGLATWSPWPAALTAVPFVLVTGLSLACLAVVVREARAGARTSLRAPQLDPAGS